MKRYLHIIGTLVCSAIILLSCQNELIPEARQEVASADSESGASVIRVALRSFDESTKTEYQTSDEKSVNSLDVFVFRTTNGSLEDHRRATNATSIDGIEVTHGEKKIVALVNFATSRLSSITQYSDLATFYPTMTYAENARNSFVMTGETTVTVSSSTATVPVTVERIVSKVELLSAPTFSGVAAGGTFNGIYMINIPKTYNPSVTLSASSSTDAWNFRNTVKTAVDASVSSLSSASVYSTPLYGMPNATTEAANVDTEDYVTKYVIKCSIGGAVYWYPIGIPGMSRNKVYQISGINIGRLGTEKPNDYFSTTELDVTVTVLDWDADEITSSYLPDGAQTSTTTYTFGGLQITPGPLYYNGTSYEIKNDSDCGPTHYTIKGKMAGSYSFSFIEMGQLFEKDDFSTSDGDIDNLLDPFDGWRLPTIEEWTTILSVEDNEAVYNYRTGATVNGVTRCYFCEIQPNVDYANFGGVGLLLFPDDVIINGLALESINAPGCYDEDFPVADLNNYISQGCIFLPSIMVSGSTYLSSTEYNTNNGRTSYFEDCIDVSNNYANKSNEYYSVRLVHE